MNAVVSLMRVLPQNAISKTIGFLVSADLPGPIAITVRNILIAAFRINTEEAELSKDSYPSFGDFFVRKLKPGSRSITSASFCSPCDGTLKQSIPAAKEVNVKGIDYQIDTLIFGKAAKTDTSFSAYWLIDIYLAPYNYHRVHMPFSGTLKSVRHVPGKLWPVNPYFVNRVPKLFAQNERLIFEIESDEGGKAYLTMVGALNVGKIEAADAPSLTTNSGHSEERLQLFETPIHKDAGEELGTFHMGSTVIMVMDQTLTSNLALEPTKRLKPVLMGQTLS